MTGSEDLLLRLVEWNRAASSRDAAVYRDDTFMKIEAIDNPGRMVMIDGEVGREFIQRNRRIDDEDWMDIRADSHKFVGYGDIAKLPDLLRSALDWVESTTTDLGTMLRSGEGYE